MKKSLVLLFVILLFTGGALKADEGMWLLSQIKKNFEEMKAKGLKLTAEDIYDVNNSCLKDAIAGLSHERVQLGFFCTGEIISDRGLMLTNHHCGFESIQQHSAVDHDYLKNGFWAKDFAEELPNDGLCVTFLVRMEDVTDKVKAELTENMAYEERRGKIKEIGQKLAKEAEKGNHFKASVESMYEENRFYLFVYETFKDVRLVGAPPSSIGKYGGDTDNWMWPRHTGDFSIFRVYMAPDGSPATYSKDNVPYKPKHHLPVSIKGVQKDDFSMVMGFPGSTDRYLTSYGITEALDITNPATVKIRTKKLEMMRRGMDKSDEVRIQYASKYAQTANYWKYFIGQSKGLKRLKVYDQKKSLEDQLVEWINQDEQRKKKYGSALTLIAEYYGKNEKKALANQYVLEALLQGGEVLMFPAQTIQFASLLEKSSDNKDLIKELAEDLKESSKEVYKDYNAQVDKDVAKELLKMYFEDVPDEYQLSIFKEVNKKFKGDIDKFVDEVFSKSIFADEARFYAFCDNPTHKVLVNDWAFKLMNSIIEQYIAMQRGGGKGGLNEGKHLFVAALMEMQKDKNFYPDANSTLRLTYGQVGDYEPADGIYYSYFTTLKGVMEKEDPTNDEFIVEAKLKELYEKKDFGQYADNDGTLHVCFTTNNDITGGNSGSPVINGNGELIGTAFDGNWEAMSGDIAFEHTLQKCINCDIRYVLFIIDKIGGAKNLIDEMTIVR